MKLALMHFVPFLAIPPTADYIKREWYVSSFKNERAELKKSKKVLDQIMAEKKAQVSFEQVLVHVCNLKLDKPLENQQ